MIIEHKELLLYCSTNGKSPFIEWFENIKDEKVKQSIQARFARIRLGNIRDCRSIEQGIYEIKINLGPGYKIYFGNQGIKNYNFMRRR